MTGATINNILAGFRDSLDGRPGKQRHVIVFGNEAQCTAFIVTLWREICSEAVKARSFLRVALSGGRSPVGVYSALAREHGVPWQMIHVFMVDERFVPQDDEDSNFGMLRNVLFNRVPIPRENIHPVKTDLPGPVEAARDYDQRISKHFSLKKGELPRFDIIMLGLGEDGHTASLFPGNPALNNTKDTVQAILVPDKRHDRVTLTLPAINNGRYVLMLVLGKNKAAMLGEILEKKDSALPAARVKPVDGHFFIIADEEAASSLAPDSYVKAPL